MTVTAVVATTRNPGIVPPWLQGPGNTGIVPPWMLPVTPIPLPGPVDDEFVILPMPPFA